MRLLILALCFSVTGCASTRFAQIGPDTFIVHRGGGSSAGDANMDAIQAAGKWCASAGRQLMVVSTQSGSDGMSYGSSVQFRCLEAGDPDLARPTLEPVASQQSQAPIVMPAPVSTFHPIQPYQMPVNPSKQTDASCLSKCMNSGSGGGFCQSKCSY